MPPKTSFSIPMGHDAKPVTQPKKTRRGVRATEEDIPLPSSKGKKSGNASKSRYQVEVEAQASGHPIHDTEESHHLQLPQAYEEDTQVFQTDEIQSQSNVLVRISPIL